MSFEKVQVIPDDTLSIENFQPDEIGFVLGALHDENWQFRTASGIEKDTGIGAQRVEAILELSSANIRKLVYRTKDDKAVYAPIGQPKTIRERVAEKIWLLNH